MDEMNLQYLEKLKKKTSTRFLIFSELEGGVVGGRGVQGGVGCNTIAKTDSLIQACPCPTVHPPPACYLLMDSNWAICSNWVLMTSKETFSNNMLQHPPPLGTHLCKSIPHPTTLA